ncbi:dihydrolipoyl dehydrogenase [Leptospira ognonensis]|uniref:Dihydrolipoyl dehydrogenase n=1 Tax=Leptospira ognonensis TaxID=2484945 RepID=A0A4R9JYM0_9LEPT|nr:dihydrolipoyl dehydrogenase [Leptospira ognonensis]TGL57295.1 dihydrolipoyl dehydrogenase [Leptospira ognonensis]
MKEFDIIVIGAGAGTKLVTPPSQLGKKVAVFEKETPGGTCLNRGCIPSKMMIYPTELLWESESAFKYPIDTKGKLQADFAAISKRVSATVDADSVSIPIAYEKNPNIEYFPYHARFVSDKVLEANGEKFTAKHIFIVVGTRPQIPAIDGLSRTPYWTSREALRNDLLPSSLIVIGAGFISLELGAAYKAYGCDVVGLTRTDILREVDKEIRQEFESHLPFPIHSHFTIQSVKFENQLFSVSGIKSDGNHAVFTAEKLLVATGIVPNSEDLGLENTQIKCNPLGYIQVNEFLETNVPGVYAFGDVIGRYFFRHSANFEGEYLFKNLYLDQKQKPIQYPSMPSAIFTHPQIATVGKTEEQLITEGKPYYKGVNRYSSSAMGMARLSDTGFVKILVDKETEKLLGAHIIGDEASNLIHQLILAIDLGATLDQMLAMIYIHPALPEVTRNAFRKVRDMRDQSKGK